MTTNNEEQPKVFNSEEEILNSDLPLGQQIDLLLDRGLSKKQLLRRGFSDPLIRQRLKKRATEGKMAIGAVSAPAPGIDSVIKGTESITPFHTIDIISNLLDGNEEQKAVFKAGMLIPVLGMQMYNEGQKSFASYMNAMRQENLEATMKALAMNQDAAHQAAMESAQMVGAQIAASQKDAAVAGADNPMKAAMATSMMPMFTNLMNTMMSKLMPGAVPPGGTVPEGWVKKTEEPKEEAK